MQQPRKQRTVVRGVKGAVVRRVEWRKPIDAEALAYALLEIIEVLNRDEHQQLAAEGDELFEQLGLPRHPAEHDEVA